MKNGIEKGYICTDFIKNLKKCGRIAEKLKDAREYNKEHFGGNAKIIRVYDFHDNFYGYGVGIKGY